MGGTFHNLSELAVIMEAPSKIAIEYVTDKIIDELNIQIATQKIGLNSNSFYEPTGEFYSAWKSEINSRLGEYMSGQVGFDYSTLSLDMDNFTHGSNYGGDVREFMPDIIFGGRSGGLFGEGFWTQERDAWTPTVEKINASFSMWLREGFAKAGFSII